MNDIENIQKIEKNLEILKDTYINNYLKKEDNNNKIKDCFDKLDNLMKNFDYNDIVADEEQIKLKNKLLEEFNNNNKKILNYITEFSNLKDLINNLN